MPRPLVMMTASYVLGIILGRYYFSFFLFGFLVLAALGWVFLERRRDSGGNVSLLPFLLILLAVGSLACSLACESVSGSIRHFSGSRGTLTGKVAGEPLWREGDVVVTLQPGSFMIEGEEHRVTGKVRVSLSLEPEQEGPVFLRYGEKVSTRGTLYEPWERRNPGGFDHRAFLETQGVAATFYGSAGEVVHLGLSPELSPFRRTALQVKEKMSGTLQAHLPAREGNLLQGMLFGERNVLDADTEGMFRASGISHLLALSGLHVGLVAAMVWFLWRRLGLGGWPLLAFTLGVLFFYVFMTGLRPSALRAFVMFGLAAGAVSLGRERDLPNALAAAAGVTLIYNPLLLFTVGFQLSYAATGAIIAVVPFLSSKIAPFFAALQRKVPWFPAERFASLVSVTLAAQLGVLPLTAYYFGEISLVALAANLLALPAVSLVLGIGFSAALAGLLLPAAGALAALASYPLLLYLLLVAGSLGSLPFSFRTVFPPHVFLLLGCYGFLFFLLAGGEGRLVSFWSRVKEGLRPAHFIISLLILALVFAWPADLLRGGKDLEVVFLDVGQGDAAYISTPGGKKVLIDGGGRPAFTGDLEGVGHRVVLPFLRQRRVSALDVVVVSHPHEDHYGGLIPVLEELPVGLLVVNADEPDSPTYCHLLELADERGVRREILSAGDRLQLEPGVVLKVMAPPRELFSGTGSDINNNSLVKRLSFRESGVLFTGDIEEAAVASLLEKGLLGPVQVLKVPHHGGYLPNMAWMLEAVNPEAAVISVGNNSFGHPHPHTLETLAERGVRVYRTDLHGAVSMRTDGYAWRAETVLEPQEEEIFLRGGGDPGEAAAQ